MRRDNDVLEGMYRLMSLTRALDRVVGAHDGHWHGLEGEEAVAAAVYYGLREGDTVAPHYRGAITAALAKGADLGRMMAGCLGKTDAYHLGRHRSDVCGPPEHGIIGLYGGSLGPPLGYACGAALSHVMDGDGDIALAVFGDGTSSRGDCHEAMNMAAIKALPVVFVCQNNQIAISTPAPDGNGGPIFERARGFGMPGARVDGNDVLKVRAAMDEAIARAREGGGPTLIEARTYRVAGHFVSDAEDYRDAAEIAAWRDRDPVARYRAFLIEEGVMDAAAMDALDAKLVAEVDAAFTAAQDGAVPDPGDLMPEDVFA
ncbi:pyruvate dehydrogenase E1 component alpha subunit [Hasllibacter halocynthiae]|uniref:Pyruvate dehydrogenase E1 component alpha subunit n=1 Tax=Hasllibacter halocynthiae TaxID=595589 RepID=A0A2T0X9W2_9RHOB|nr:thiamine pyrophosphate-dependent dehydrogenase E1 component subunit alpha [Hasllibacter halocynthiae]PRY95717.1 pyruvate dehydrogenase E1 component alpha subunit [Hasllibacter halocynthiae]